jgi:uncharacterized protein (TIGR04551 family)
VSCGLARTAAFAILLGGCPRFHAEPLPGAPAGAKFVDVDGVHVHYRDTGEGPAVVLIHGFGASSDSWATVTPELASHHRVIAVDLKGFGWTSRPEGDYSPAAEAQLVWGLLDKLHVTDVAIVGHSWGSSVALAMAVAQPARVRRVALYSAYVYDDQVPSFFRWAEKPGLGELLFGLYYKQRIEDRAPLAYFDERWVTQQRVDKVEADLDRPGTVAAALAVARRHHFSGLHEALKKLTRPVLLLWGENDEVTPLRFGHRLASELANAEIRVYPRCGHIPMVEAHAQSTRDLAAFLDKDVAAPVATPPADPPADPAPPSPNATRSNPIDNARSSFADGSFVPTSGTILSHVAVVPGGSATAVPTRSKETSGGTRRQSVAVPNRGTYVGDRGADVVTEGVDVRGAAGGGGGGGSEGGGIAVSPTGSGTIGVDRDVADEDVAAKRRVNAPELVPDQKLPVGADLAALGAELTPRLYAAPREGTQIVVHGALRVRDAQLYNLDLDRGLDSRGQPIFPVPLGGGQRIDAMDLRARTDVALYARGVGVAVKARIDWLDNVALGGDPDLSNGSPATSPGQRPTAVVIKRAWGEALTPLGILAVGRMGAHFGLGISANGGDCEDCDHGDAADRAAFVAPLAGHLVAFAYDIAARGPFTRSRDGGHALALEPSDGAAGPTLAILKVHSPAALARRADAGRTSVEYGAYLARRAQDRDVPASYLPTATAETMFTSSDLVARGFSATSTGGWLRVSNATIRLEAELVYARANIAQPSLIPGAEITTPITSSQLGFALESEVTAGAARLGVDAGYASGDDAPGFGAFPVFGEAAPAAGAFDGPQANPPRDRTVDNFRFHPDYHIDQILFREIIGTITDAIYLRPYARLALLEVGPGRLELGAALIASWAVEPTSTPSGERALGIELDPQLRYASRDGFAMTLDYGLLLPGAAFDGTTLQAKPAQAFRARVGFAF